MRKILPYIILLSALAVSGSAAFYSVYGLSKLFAGAALQVAIMAGSLEVSKLIIATLLHEYWNRLNRLLRIYLTLATVVLVLITSAGIYGFLSNAYQLTANQDKIVTRGIELVDTKQKVFEQSKTEYATEKESVVQSISELRKSLSNPGQVQFVDRRTGKIVTSTSNDPKARASLEKQLDDAVKRRDELTQKIQVASDSIGKFEVEKIELENNSDAAAELGPLKYISGLTGIPMDRVVNYFLLLIIFVFDPLAISLVLAANFAFKESNKEKEIAETEIKIDTNTDPFTNDIDNISEFVNIVNDEIETTEKIEENPLEKRLKLIREKKKTIATKDKKPARKKTEAPTEENVKKKVTPDTVNEMQPDTANLTPNQIKNMSHESIRRYISKNTT